MGYRLYLSSYPKDKYLEIKDLTQAELIEKFDSDDGHFYWRDLDPDVEQLHELGKYCDFGDKEVKSRFFTHEMDFEGDMEFSLGSKELLLHIIDEYRQYVVNWYTRLKDGTVEPFEKKNPDRVDNHFSDMIREWGGDGWNMTPYDINDDTDSIVTSWKYEYAVFELVRIYKSIDWDKTVLIYHGY